MKYPIYIYMVAWKTVDDVKKIRPVSVVEGMWRGMGVDDFIHLFCLK